jgi:hypothetical protein
MKFRFVFWDVLPCKIIVDNYFTRQYIPKDKSELQRIYGLRDFWIVCVCACVCVCVYYKIQINRNVSLTNITLV